MKTIAYDGTFPGFLCAAESTGIYHSDSRHSNYLFTDKSNPQHELAEHVQEITTDKDKAREAFRMIRRKAGSVAASMLHYAFMSEKRGREELLLTFILRALKHGTEVCNMHGNPDIKTVMEWSNAVCREKHRYMGILRFREAAPGLLRADFKPRYHICPLLSDHFSERMRTEFWMIADMERNYAVFHCPDKKETLRLKDAKEIEKICPPDLPDTEYEVLWQKYFQAMEIPERKNSKCQSNFIPKRDRDYMVEFQR